MNCPYCGKVVSGNVRCENCGKRISVLVKAIKLSNNYYNAGLSKAKVHDLSGAIIDLKKSLKLNKSNTMARNLLGLVYYECGEIVSALSEWVLSKHFQPEDNELAERFLDDIQSSPSRIENYNQSFKKFNLALTALRQDNQDLALIQLKKVINLNPNYLKALHLLTLIYIHNEQYDKAKKVLKRARKIDISNNTTLTYIAEVRSHDPNVEQSQPQAIAREVEDMERTDYQLTRFPFSSYRDEKPNVMLYINLVIGLIIGLGVTMFLVVPTVRRSAASKYNVAILENNDGLTTSEVEISNLNKTIDNLKEEVAEKEKDIKSANDKVGGFKCYDYLFEASRLFIAGDKEGAAEALSKVDTSKFASEDANVLYEYIKGEVYDDVIKQLAAEGRSLCNSGKEQEALVPLLKAYNLSKDNEGVLYFLGRSYQKLEDKDTAKKYFEELLEKFPTGSRSSTAKKRLREMGFEVPQTANQNNNDDDDGDNQYQEPTKKPEATKKPTQKPAEPTSTPEPIQTDEPAPPTPEPIQTDAPVEPVV